MNARSFLGDDRISALRGQGLSDVQIRDYAKNEYQKTIAASPRGSNLGIDGREIPAAPMSPEAPTQRKGFFSGLGNDLKRTANAFIEDSILGDYGTGASVADKAKIDVARAQNNKGLIRTLTQDDDEKRENSRNLAADYEKIAKQYGYDLGAIIDGDKIYFGRTDENGQIKTIDATPNFSNHALANKYEIASGVLGALIPGGLAVKMAGSATGSGIGAGADYANRAKSLNENADATAIINRALEGATDDLAAGAIVGGTLKYGKEALGLSGKALKASGKLLDNSVVADATRHLTADNISGAQAQLNNMLGGEAAARASQNAAKEALGESGYKHFVNNDREFILPQTSSERVNKAVDFINQKGLVPAQKSIKRILLGEKVAEKEADLLLGALGHEDGAKVILNSIATEPKAFAKANKAFSELNRNLKQGLDNEFKDAPNVIDVIKGYEKRTQADFDGVIKTLDENFNTLGVNTQKLSQDVGNALKDTLSPSSYITKHVVKEVEGGGIGGLQKARAFVNSEISKLGHAIDVASREKTLELQEAKKIIDNAIDESLSRFEQINPNIGARARELMQTARDEYRNFKEIQTSDVYQKITGKLKTTDDLTDILIKSADNQTGLSLGEILGKLDAKDRAVVESGLFKNILDRFTKDEITDFKGAMQVLNRLPFQSSRVAGAVEQLNKNAALLNNTSEILSGIKGMTPKTVELQQGIGKTVTGAIEVMARNRIVNKLKSRIPYLGNNQALKNHIANALRNAGDLSVVIRNIDAIPKENMDSLTKTGLEKFKNEIIPEIRQIIKETQGETAEQGSKLERAGAKQVVEKQGSGASIGGLTANSNAHLGSGMVAGALNSVDEDGNFSPERFAAGFLAGLVGSKAAAVGLRKMTPKLYNQILGAAEKMPQMANGNPRLLGKLYSNGKDVSLNSFAGEKAITANVGKLDQAKAMLEKGADEVEIWQKTGWFKDKDGAWKFEIGDSNAKLNPNFQSGGRLDKLLEHEELFKAYPELKDVRVVKIGDETPSGAALSVKDAAQREKRGIYNVAFNNKKSTIIRKDLDAIDEIIKFEKGEADYMLHGERKSGYGALHIQKHLDTQNNGWVTKQEYLDMGQMLRKSMMEEADDKRIYTYFNDEGIRFRVVIGIGKNKERVISFYSNRKPLKAGLSYNSQNYDGNLPLNDDIIAQNGAKGYYSPAKNEIGLSDLGDKSTLMHEVQHAIQEIEDFARGGDFNTVWSVAAKNIEKKYESELAELEKISNDAWQKYAPLQKEYIKLFDEGLKDTPEAQRLLKQMREFSDESSRADREIRELRQAVNDEQNAITEEDLQEIYRKIHGEAEARNVQNRLNLDRKAHPHETFDVNPNETIVSKEDGISYSRKIEEQRFAGTGRDKTTIMYATPHVGTGLAGGTLNAKDENGNFDAEKFAKGFIYGLFGSKITAATLKKTNPKLYDQIVKIAEGNASKEKISSFVNKLKQDELGKLLQKTVTNKDLSTKTKVEIIEAAKSRYAQEIK